MEIIYSDQEIPKKITKSIFLAGPSPRGIVNKELNWREKAITTLSALQYDGTVFIPIPKDKFSGGNDNPNWNYDDQVEWEIEARNTSDLIVFWVDRDISNNMLGLTTNVEFGEDLTSGKLIYGRPDDADNIRYLDKRVIDTGLTVYSSMDDMMSQVVNQLGSGAPRVGGECKVPLFIWNTSQFQNWYTSLVENGNILKDAKLQRHLTFKNGYVFSFILWVNVWITKEKRFKDNEFIFSRSDISCILPIYQDENDTHIVLVKEFRSPVRNTKGMVYELPGGSSMKPGVDPLLNAHEEMLEETGVDIKDTSRFKYICSKQLCSTLSTHYSHLYAVNLTKDEFGQILHSIASNATHGVAADTEMTYLDIVPLSSIMDYPLDLSMIGMIFGGVQQLTSKKDLV